jgi:hypothetical protein
VVHARQAVHGQEWGGFALAPRRTSDQICPADPCVPLVEHCMGAHRPAGVDRAHESHTAHAEHPSGRHSFPARPRPAPGDALQLSDRLVGSPHDVVGRRDELVSEKARPRCLCRLAVRADRHLMGGRVSEGPARRSVGFAPRVTSFRQRISPGPILGWPVELSTSHVAFSTRQLPHPPDENPAAARAIDIESTGRPAGHDRAHASLQSMALGLRPNASPSTARHPPQREEDRLVLL